GKMRPQRNHYPLLLGPYRVPLFWPGDEAFCEMRGRVVIAKPMHNAPIGAWPKARSGKRGASILLAGDLVRAVARLGVCGCISCRSHSLTPFKTYRFWLLYFCERSHEHGQSLPRR